MLIIKEALKPFVVVASNSIVSWFFFLNDVIYSVKKLLKKQENTYRTF